MRTLLALAFALAAVWTDASAKSFLLSKVEFKGLHRYSQEQAVQATGLKIGQAVDPASIDALAKRVSETGLFRQVDARYRNDNVHVVLTFEVLEAEWDVPVVFDNFVWFGDGELAALVARRVPTFDGKAPRTGGVLASIRTALERAVEARGVRGRVVHLPSIDERGGELKHVYRVDGVHVPVCALHFPGASAVPEGELARLAEPLLLGEYSRLRVEAFAGETLLAAYHDRAYLRARFGEPSARRGEGPECVGGVVVLVPVEEGAPYTWERAAWSGNVALPSDELDALLGMEGGEPAGAAKIRVGLKAVVDAYRKMGFLDARLVPRPVFPAGGTAVAYEIGVGEGPRYRMGKLTISGLSERDRSFFAEQWKLREGDLYDAVYVERFSEEFFADRRVKRVAGRKSTWTATRDETRRTVDVVLQAR